MNRGKLFMKFHIISLAVILLFGFATAEWISGMNAYGEEQNLVCSEGKVLVYRTISDKYACVYPSTADKWHTTGFSEPVQQVKSFDIPPIHAEKMRTSAPLPETTKGPQIDYSKGYLVEEIKDGLYWVTDGAYNTMFLTTGQGVIVVDAPPSIGENYLKAIAEVTEEPVTHVIYSHTHNDHVGSISMFPDDAIYISHQEIADTLAKRNDPNRPVPSITFEDKYTLEIVTQTLELEYAGPMHESGNIFIYAPQQKVLMLVDVVFPGWTPFKDLAMAQDVLEFLAAHDKILEYDFDTYIGGHLTRLGTVEDVEIQKEYFQDIQASAGKANQEVSFMAIGQEVGFSNPWLVFQIYADQITQQCTDEVVPKWIDRLGAVDLFTYDHCWKISEAQRID
jgi:glyoxylase-like metal-dependent hydrolase (beta-lactamase superfamily II)